MRDRRAAARPGTVWVLIGVAALLTLVFAWLVARHLTDDSNRASAIYGHVFSGLADPRESGATEALLRLAVEIRAAGIPIVVTDANGIATDTANLPQPLAFDSPEMRAFVAALDRVNRPVSEPGVGTIHFGAAPVRGQLRLVFLLELVSLLGVLGAGLLAWRATVRGERDRVFVAMARESAHQLGTPLTSLAGWIEQLKEGAGERAAEVAGYLEADFYRLKRVASRFERIGQPPRRERVDLGAMAAAQAAYFRPRLPRLANQVTIDVEITSSAPAVEGDALLLEWAIEALVKNAVDALKGRSGAITLQVRDEPESVVLSVEDDGPGVSPDMLGDLFAPGSTTKTGGWGLGLALTRRIIEEGHAGSVALEPSSRGARFAIRLPRVDRG